jgi:hypothetical protein
MSCSVSKRRACLPVEASETAYPAALRTSAIMRRMDSSSSTIKILCASCGWPATLRLAAVKMLPSGCLRRLCKPRPAFLAIAGSGKEWRSLDQPGPNASEDPQRRGIDGEARGGPGQRFCGYSVAFSCLLQLKYRAGGDGGIRSTAALRVGFYWLI